MAFWIPPTVLASRNVLENVLNDVHDSRRQLHNRFGNGLVEVSQTLAIHSTTERDAHVCAGNSKSDIIFLIEH